MVAVVTLAERGEQGGRGDSLRRLAATAAIDDEVNMVVDLQQAWLMPCRPRMTRLQGRGVGVAAGQKQSAFNTSGLAETDISFLQNICSVDDTTHLKAQSSACRAHAHGLYAPAIGLASLAVNCTVRSLQRWALSGKDPGHALSNMHH